MWNLIKYLKTDWNVPSLHFHIHTAHKQGTGTGDTDTDTDCHNKNIAAISTIEIFISKFSQFLRAEGMTHLHFGTFRSPGLPAFFFVVLYVWPFSLLWCDVFCFVHAVYYAIIVVILKRWRARFGTARQHTMTPTLEGNYCENGPWMLNRARTGLWQTFWIICSSFLFFGFGVRYFEFRARAKMWNMQIH